MQLFQYVAVIASLLSVTVNSMPMAGLGISELAYLLKGFKGEKLVSCDLSKAIMPKSGGRFPPTIGHESLGEAVINNYHRSQLSLTTGERFCPFPRCSRSRYSKLYLCRRNQCLGSDSTGSSCRSL